MLCWPRTERRLQVIYSILAVYSESFLDAL